VSPSVVSGPVMGSDRVLLTRRPRRGHCVCGSRPPLTPARRERQALPLKGGVSWILATSAPACTEARTIR